MQEVALNGTWQRAMTTAMVGFTQACACWKFC